MDWQDAFNIVYGIAALLGGWTLKGFYDAINELRHEDGALHDRVTKLATSLPDTYARRDDMKEIKETLVRIESKIDRKVDK